MSVADWFDNLKNDKGGAPVVEKDGYSLTGKYSMMYTFQTTSLYSGLEYLLTNGEKNTRIILIPFDSCYICFITEISNGKIDSIEALTVKNNWSGFKTCASASRAKHDTYIRFDIQSTNNINEIITAVIDGVFKKGYAAKMNKLFPTKTTPKNVTNSSNDVPFELKKNPKFPPYILYCKVKDTENDAVKRYSNYGNVEIFVETVEKDGNKYYKVLMGNTTRAFEYNSEEKMGKYYLTSLSQLDKFLEFTLKPNRRKQNSELGEDGEIHVWTSAIQKKLPSALKRDTITDETLIKSLNFHDFNIYSLYKK